MFKCNVCNQLFEGDFNVYKDSQGHFQHICKPCLWRKENREIKGDIIMEELKKKALKELKEVRDSGRFNMFTERRAVMQYANNEGMYSLVSYVGNDVRGKYAELLNADWGEIDEG